MNADMMIVQPVRRNLYEKPAGVSNDESSVKKLIRRFLVVR